MSKSIAIIGTGIAGMTTGYLLNKKHAITVFEANDYIGGHTATKKVNVDGRDYSIDTGFIVYNDWTYPNFIKLMDTLGVVNQATEMSFSVKNMTTGLEYNGNNLNTLFAQRRNLFSPSFYRTVLDIVKFNKLCKAHLEQSKPTDNITLLQFIKMHNLSDSFTNNYILPMCAAIWSTSMAASANFPLSFFLKFFNNHGLLNITNRPQWRTLIGGSNTYVEPITRDFKEKIRLSSPVQKVIKQDGKYVVYSVTDNRECADTFDEVIFACHSDQALKMLEVGPENQLSEHTYKDVLGAIPYAANDVVLHTDISVLPKRKLAWASWNYEVDGSDAEASKPANLTYNMNILQCIESDTTFCVSLNNSSAIDPKKILGRYSYAHPQFSPSMVDAQNKRGQICGIDGLHFCGAYWYNGFHEDGVRSALDVCQRFGAEL